MPDREVQVHLTLSERQAAVVQAALDLYARVHMGQFDAVLSPFRGVDGVKYQEARSALAAARQQVYPGLAAGSYYSIRDGRIAESARVAWDVQQVLRHAVAWAKQPGGGFGVQFDAPWKSADEPLATVKVEPRLYAGKREFDAVLTPAAIAEAERLHRKIDHPPREE